MAYHISRINEPASFYIPGGVTEGRQVIIRGKVDYSAQRFHINLQEDDDNVAFHFNPRQNGDCVVRNTKEGGSWQNEEREIPYFPFSEGKTFQIKIEVAREEFRVYVNGKHFIDYGHRMDLRRIRYLALSKGAEYYDVTFQNKHAIPYTLEIPGGMEVGKALRFRGACTDSDGFAINFADTSGLDNHMFHFNARPREGCVVRNANIGGWGEEERDQEDFPFSPGQYFDCFFVVTDIGYMVYVNDKLFTIFRHRCDLHDAKVVNIQGNVDIADMQYLEPQGDGVKKIPSGLEKGDVVTFRGYFKPDGERFSVNLMNGYDDDSDIALHFNPRRGQHQVVLNNRLNGSWQEEERHELPKAFEDIMPFEIKFIVKRDKFKIFVNDKKYSKFNARGNLEDIKGIYVAGAAYIYSVALLRKLELPYWERIPDGLHPGDWIVVKGTPKKNRGGFVVNLRCDDDEAGDIALHFNPRLDEQCVVRNDRVAGAWHREERGQLGEGYPFGKRDAFEIAMNVKDDKFVFFVNGDRFAEFNHRMPIEAIRYIHLNGIADFFEPEFY